MLTTILDVWLIIIGKVIYGVGAGGIMVACALYLAETIPSTKGMIFGTAINTGIVTGSLLCLILGLGLPDPDSRAAQNTNLWKWINATPIFFTLVSLFIWAIYFPFDSLHNGIRRK